MGTGMWTAAAGASAQAENLDLIANNLANLDTDAFKKDLPTFKEYLTTLERNQDSVDIPRGPLKDKDFYPLDGRDQSFVILDGTHTQFKQGNLKVTHSQFDVALEGPGFLEVSTPVGTRYTRLGNLKLNPKGLLVTMRGDPVLAADANFPQSPTQTTPQPPTGRYIQLKDQGTYFSINEKGQIYSGDQLIDNLSIVEFKDLKKIKKEANQLFHNRDPNNLTSPDHTQVRQGVLESSNVNPIEEMTQMIKANRLFEQDLKALKTYGELLGKEANEIGKI